ncbi:MAG: hypothetical protein K6G46_04950 [Prevotella sp.]|nr:hypothetical protein [Prevotella sp.]
MERRRCAEMLFYEGVLHFSYPSEWIKKAEEGNVGQGEQTKPAGREGDYVEYDMSDAYAQDFSGEETWENRFNTEFPDRKTMVVIHRPQVFLDKVKRRFADFKLEEGRD